MKLTADTAKMNALYMWQHHIQTLHMSDEIIDNKSRQVRNIFPICDFTNRRLEIYADMKRVNDLIDHELMVLDNKTHHT